MRRTGHLGRVVAVAAVATASVALPAVASAGVHATFTSYGVSTSTVPSRIVTGDFDGDGVVDLVASGANLASGDFAVLFGRGGGTFAAVTGAATPRPEDVAVADFDEDGLDDIVLPADMTGAGTILLSNGDGTFDAAIGAIPAGSTSVATGDFDADGHSDIAVAAPGNQVIVLPGVGDGTVGAPSAPVATGGAGGITRIATGDFDGNGRDDIVAAPGATIAGQPSVATLLSAPDGTLQAAVPAAEAGGIDLRVADLNEDGRSDVVLTAAFVPAASILLGQPGGTLGGRRDATVLPGTTPALGDVNHDGHQDLVVASEGTGGVSVLFGAGNGTFASGVTVPGTGRAWTTALAADLDGDGFADLALGTSSGTVVVGRNAPSALLSTPSLAFAATAVGAGSPVATMAVANDSQPGLAISGVALGGASPGDFKVLADGCTGHVLPAGGTCGLSVAMAPTAAGGRGADLVIASNSAGGVAHVALAGTGVAALAPPDVTAPTIGIVLRGQRLRVVLRLGFRAGVSCSEACTADTRLILSRAQARHYHLPSRTPIVAARRTVRMTNAGRTTVTLRLTRRVARAVRDTRRLPLTFRVSARDASGNTRARSRTVRVRR